MFFYFTFVHFFTLCELKKQYVNIVKEHLNFPR